MATRLVDGLRASLATLAVTFPLAAQPAHGGKLTPAPEQPSLDLPVAIQATHRKDSRVTYTLPGGEYVPVFADAAGTYFLCGSGIPGLTDLSSIGGPKRYMRMLGGIYLPAKEAEAPKLWIIGAAKAAVAGNLDIDETEARRLEARCETRDAERTVSSYQEMAKGSAGPATTMGALGNALINGIVGSRDGRIVFPPVSLSTEISPTPRKAPDTTPVQTPEELQPPE